MSSIFHDRRTGAVPAVSPAIGRAGWRTLLVAGCCLTGVGAWALGEPVALQATDPDLAFLLRAMALIKATLVAAGLSVLWWRLGWPIATFLAAGYVLAGWLVAGATVMIWQLTSIAAAAVIFHAAGLAWVGLMWLDYRAEARVR
jgi:hypothetical protein